MLAVFCVPEIAVPLQCTLHLQYLLYAQRIVHLQCLAYIVYCVLLSVCRWQDVSECWPLSASPAELAAESGIATFGLTGMPLRGIQDVSAPWHPLLAAVCTLVGLGVRASCICRLFLSTRLQHCMQVGLWWQEALDAS